MLVQLFERRFQNSDFKNARGRFRTPQARLTLICLLAVAFFAPISQTQAPSGVPTFKIDPPPDSKVTFSVKASVPIQGVFDKWDATVNFASTDVTTGVLDIKVNADSVNTGSGMKDGKLKGKDFFDAKDNPYITFHSDKPTQSGPNTVSFPGTFTIRGVSKPETLVFTVVARAGTGVQGEVKGSMAFDRKDYGMNSGIPFIKIADRVEVDVDLKGERVSGPPIALKQ
jgi:polyisoprenoid-binding protein YceI